MSTGPLAPGCTVCIDPTIAAARLLGWSVLDSLNGPTGDLTEVLGSGNDVGTVLAVVRAPPHEWSRPGTFIDYAFVWGPSGRGWVLPSELQVIHGVPQVRMTRS